MPQTSIQSKLLKLLDIKYRDFHAKLIPTIDKNKIIGVRTPVLRKFAKKFSKSPEAAVFMEILPHKYYEENNLHGFLIENINNFEKSITAIDKFLPYVDNWATCDLISPKIFKKHLPELLIKIEQWINSKHTYTIRFGIRMLLNFYLDDDEFCPQYLALVAAVNSEEYYVKMMIAWYFATALAKQYENTLPYIANQKLDFWTHNKSIQKAVESHRISDEQKRYLKTLKVK
ncbi:MAG: DNA alkylation repair protein [Clostridia bacterium]